MSNSFLPAGISVPASEGGAYTKFAGTETRLRSMSPPIQGWEYWTTDDKAVRSATEIKGRPANMREKNKFGEAERVQGFWAMIVWNYTSGRIEVWQCKQVTLLRALHDLIKDEDWGDPRAYDLKVKKTQGDKVSYTLTAVPKQPMSAEIKAAFKATPIDRGALLTGGTVFLTAPDGAEAAASKPAPAAAAPKPAKAQAQPAVTAPDGDEDLPF